VKTIHIINPAAGKGRAAQFAPPAGEELYRSLGPGDVERFLADTLRRADEPVRFIVHGGDGTVNEAVNGIMHSGASHLARLSVLPQGSGNDFARTLALLPKGEFAVDVIRCRSNLRTDDRYAVNIVNVGFDCDVVVQTNRYKKLPLITGSFAYIMGIADVFFHSIGRPVRVTMQTAAGTEVMEDHCTLAAMANGQFYGGGFRAASLADISDGLLDVMFIRRVTRPQFISLIGDYKKGTHMDPETCSPKEKFAKIVDFRRCTAVRIEGLNRFCADGEIMETQVLEAEILPGAITLINA